MTEAAETWRRGRPATRAAGREIASRPGPIAPAVALALGVFVCLTLGSSQLLNDPDTQWHVATGRWIWSHRSFPRSDVFSHTFAGAPWIAKEWLSQLILFGAHAAAGWRGVALTAAAAAAATYGMLFAWLARRLRASIALAATLAAAMLAAPHLLARPHLLVFPVIALWMMRLVDSLERRSAPPLHLALLMVLWTNMHGSFPLGLALAGLAAAEGVLVRPAGARIVVLRRWALFVAAACMASLVSPYGWSAIVVPLKIGGNAAVPFLTEWQPLAFDTDGLVALALFALALLILCADARINLFRIVAVVAVGALMVRHSRFVDLFGIIAAILVAETLAKRRFAQAGGHEAADTGPAASLAIAVLALAAGVAAAVVAPKPSPSAAPEGALRAAMAKGVSGPVYNDYDFGGFLIVEDVNTFVDGRSDQLFLGDFLPDLQRALDGKDHRDFARLMARHRVAWALVRRGSPDAAHLAAMPGWSKLFQDDVAAVFAETPARTAPH